MTWAHSTSALQAQVATYGWGLKAWSYFFTDLSPLSLKILINFLINPHSHTARVAPYPTVHLRSYPAIFRRCLLALHT